MSRPRDTTVLIAGAGIGGLTAALALHAVGTPAHLVDRARELRGLGLGINLLPHAVRELTALGFGDDLARTGVATAENVYLDARGRHRWTEPRGRAQGYRWPQYSVHRGTLQELLLTAVRERLGAAAVRPGTALAGLAQDADGVTATLRDAAGREHRERAAVLVGADGLHSAVLDLLHPGHPPLRSAGVTMWRGLGVVPSFRAGRSMILASDGRGTRLVAYPIAPPDADGRQPVNWVLMAATGAPGPVDGPVGNTPAGAGEVLDHLAGWDLGELDVTALVTGSPEVHRHPMVDREPLASWSVGRATLLGDAAHPMYPVGANGGSQAIVDGRVLASCLSGGPAVAPALARYEAARRPDTAATVRANRAMDRDERALAAGDGGAGSFSRLTAAYRDDSGGGVDRVNRVPGGPEPSATVVPVAPA